MKNNTMSTRFRSSANHVLEVEEPFDVWVIGSGFAGTVLGTSLVQRGIRTVILESAKSAARTNHYCTCPRGQPCSSSV